MATQATRTHYEVVAIIHPDYSDQVAEIIDRYALIVTDNGGVIHRKEDSGRRRLAYPIQKVYKGHFILLNIEANTDALEKLQYQFKYSDLVLRSLVTKVDEIRTGESILLKSSKETSKSGSERQNVIANARKSPVDYKDAKALSKFILESGRIIPNRVLGLPAIRQRQIAVSVKRARYLSLISYCDRHR